MSKETRYLTIKEIEERFHSELKKRISNPEDVPIEKLESTAQEVLTSLRVNRKATVKVRCTLIPPKCEIIIAW
jgi:hypothetical protein